MYICMYMYLYVCIVYIYIYIYIYKQKNAQNIYKIASLCTQVTCIFVHFVFICQYMYLIAVFIHSVIKLKISFALLEGVFSCWACTASTDRMAGEWRTAEDVEGAVDSLINLLAPELFF